MLQYRREYLNSRGEWAAAATYCSIFIQLPIVNSVAIDLADWPQSAQ